MILSLPASFGEAVVTRPPSIARIVPSVPLNRTNAPIRQFALLQLGGGGVGAGRLLRAALLRRRGGGLTRIAVASRAGEGMDRILRLHAHAGHDQDHGPRPRGCEPGEGAKERSAHALRGSDARKPRSRRRRRRAFVRRVASVAGAALGAGPRGQSVRPESAAVRAFMKGQRRGNPDGSPPHMGVSALSDRDGTRLRDPLTRR